VRIPSTLKRLFGLGRPATGGPPTRTCARCGRSIPTVLHVPDGIDLWCPDCWEIVRDDVIAQRSAEARQHLDELNRKFSDATEERP